MIPMRDQTADYHNLEIDNIQYLVQHKYSKDQEGNEQFSTRLIAPNKAMYLIEPVMETIDGQTIDTGYRTIRPLTRSDSVMRDEHGRRIKLFQVADMLEHVGYFEE